jgi:FkbM family methyltransferase
MVVALESATAGNDRSRYPASRSAGEQDKPQNQPLLKRRYWGIRQALGFPPAHDAETLHRLRQRADGRSASTSRAGSFRFPWGRVDYVHAGQLRSQFEEIFVGRQYAFASDRPDPVIIDCGGNIGLSAIWFKLTYPRCRLIVFEADANLAALSRENLRRAGFDDVEVRCAAVWIANETVAFLKTGGDSGRIATDGSTKCAAVDLSEWLPERVDLLKLDIEGAEFRVLHRLCETGVMRRVRRLICEFHVWRDKTDDLLRTLASLRANEMQFSMTAAAVPWIGLAEEDAPFESVRRNHVLMEVFAWHSEGLKP